MFQLYVIRAARVEDVSLANREEQVLPDSHIIGDITPNGMSHWNADTAITDIFEVGGLNAPVPGTTSSS